MIHPYLCWLGIFLSFAVSLALFTSGRLDVHEYFYAPALLLIGFYTLHSILTDKQRYQKRTVRQVIPKAIGKYVLWGLIIYGVTRFYAAHPLYEKFTPNTRRFFGDFLIGFLILGLPYFFLAEKFRYCQDNVLGDPYLRILSLLKCLKNREFRLIWRRLAKKSYKRIYLMAIIRIHYVPIMFEQVCLHLKGVTGFLRGPNFQWNLASSLAITTALAWAIDANNGAIGYFWESWFTKSRFRQIDLHPIHWFVVLICYMPFFGYAVQFVPFLTLVEDSAPLIGNSSFNFGLDIALLIFLVLYVLSGSALNFSTSNLCYKKIQTKGPYAIVRHPATSFKLFYFFLAFFRYRRAYTFAGLLCYLVWITVYICRALVEESFLKKFSDYRRYMKKTRYRFIPRIC
jgi:protein-S-isoprenylcysteine O-methyltransferase Ste14